MKEMLGTPRKRHIVYLGIALILTVLRIGVFVRMPYYIIPDSGYDDSYLMNTALSMLNGSWLGGYGHTTLIKGISFPVFLALSNWLNLPYAYSLALYYILSAGIFCLALSRLTDKRLPVLLAYGWLIFSPLTFAYESTFRIYRIAIVFPAVLHCLGLMLLVYLNREKPVSRQVPWIVWSGLAFGFFYYIREESIWMLPLFLGSLLLTAVWIIWFSGLDRRSSAGRRSILVRCAALLLAPAVFLLTGTGIAALNRHYYGVYEINDRVNGPFAELTGNMFRIEKPEGEEDPDIWISRAKYEKIIDACPTLSEHKDLYLDVYSAWGSGGDVRGDMSVWAFRAAMNLIGYYRNAGTSDAMCRQINAELLKAVNEGKLSFDNAFHFTTQSRGIFPGEISGFIGDTFRNIWNIMTFRDARTDVFISGEDPAVRKVEAITGVMSVHSNKMHARTVTGWLVWKHNEDGPVTLRLLSGDGAVLTEQIATTVRDDVQKAFPDFSHASDSGFSAEVDSSLDADQCMIEIRVEGKEAKTIPLTENTDDEDVLMRVESISEPSAEDPFYLVARDNASRSNQWLQVGRWVSGILTVLSLIAWVLLWVLFIRKRCWASFEPAAILTGILLSIFILEFGVTVFNSWQSPVFFYSPGLPALGQAFQILSLVWVCRVGAQALKKQKGK